MDYAQETTFAYSDWKQINDPKLKIYAFQGQEDGESKVFSVKKLLSWLKEHKGNKNAPYNSIDFFVVDQNLFGDVLTYEKETFRVHKNSFEAYQGDLDLSANGDVVDKTGFYIDFGRNHTQFYLDVYPPRKNKDIAEKAIISLYTESYREFDAMLRFLNFKISEKAKNHIITKYQEQLKKANNDPDKIDVVFETIPDFVITNFSQDELATSLKNIAQTTISGKTTFGTNEEKAILNIVKALGNKNADLLLNTLSKNRKGNKSDSPYLFEVLYQNMDNVGGDDNFTTYIQLLYKYWLKSSYSNKEVQDYIPYNSERSWGFYSDNVKTSLIYDKIHLQITNKENTYVPDVSYHLYDKINLLSLNQNTDGLKFPSKEIPAFYLMAVKEVNKGTNIQTGLGLTFDAVTTISGVGNLAKLRYLSGVAKGVKTAIAGIEISSGVLNAMITLSDCESGFCNDLRTYLFWLEMASLGADTFTQQQIRQSAEKALKSADNSLSKEIKEELARVSKSVDDVFSSTRFIVKTEEELKAYLETLSDLPKGVTYNGSIYRSLSKNAVDNYGAVPNQISDYSVDNAWGRYDLQGEAALYCSETLSGNKTEIMYYANKYGQKWEDYFTYEYNNITITNMLDLTDDLVRQKLGINESMLKRVKELSDETVEKKYNYLFTNVLGSWAREKYNGLIVPGTRGGNYKNIILFRQDIVNNTIGSSIPSPIKK